MAMFPPGPFLAGFFFPLLYKKPKRGVCHWASAKSPRQWGTKPDKVGDGRGRVWYPDPKPARGWGNPHRKKRNLLKPISPQARTGWREPKWGFLSDRGSHHLDSCRWKDASPEGLPRRGFWTHRSNPKGDRTVFSPTGFFPSRGEISRF